MQRSSDHLQLPIPRIGSRLRLAPPLLLTLALLSLAACHPTPIPMEGITVAGRFVPHRSVVHEENSFIVVMVVHGSILWVPTGEEFTAMGWTPADLVTLPVGSLASVPRVPRRGALIKERTDAAIYWIADGTRHWVSPELFRLAGFTVADLTIVPNGSSGHIPRGADFRLRDLGPGHGG